MFKHFSATATIVIFSSMPSNLLYLEAFQVSVKKQQHCSFECVTVITTITKCAMIFIIFI